MNSDNITSEKIPSNNPWWYIPTLYFAEGLPYVIINSVSVIMYKKMGIDNTQIALWTSLLYLPWVIKMLWGPFVDIYSTKRNWVIYTQVAMMVCLGSAAFSLQLSNFFFISLGIFTIGAFISATHDIATDGFYMLALSPEQQALYAGIRSVFYRMAVIFGTGVLVVFAGLMEENIGNIPLSWSFALAISAVIFALLFVYHRFILPFPDSDSQDRKLEKTEQIPFVDIINSYFQQPKILVIVAFILFYRFGEAMLLKLASPFLLDTTTEGGLGLSTADVGLVYGTVGTISLIIGGIVGGAIVAKYGLKKTIFPLALALNLPDLFYVYMAYYQPPIQFVYPLVSLEQFGYGLGFTSFMIYLMYVSKGEYKTSHYAISTGIMALGMMVPGMVSGKLQSLVSYPMFFVIVCLLTIPGMITIFFLPLEEEKKA
ncbi:MFS transporter [Planktothricoides raciborskii]|uniref:MFS transporter n=1 Tax=Planktothricoides raciborskii GIHE-MW2 TaxID=2792601 RepID=A0AAU8JA24_9CYAN